MSEPGTDISTWDTGLGGDVLKWVGAQSVNFPESFNVHSHLRHGGIVSNRSLKFFSCCLKKHKDVIKNIPTISIKNLAKKLTLKQFLG